MQPRESGSGAVRKETPMLYMWNMCKSVHRRGGGWCRDGNGGKATAS